MPKKYIRSRRLSFVYAFKGLKALFLSQENFKIHILAAILVNALGFYFGISNVEWALIWICISAVLCAEAFNTAIEEIINLLHPDHHPKAGLIKDVSATAVLLFAFGSIIVACLIFIPYIKEVIN